MSAWNVWPQNPAGAEERLHALIDKLAEHHNRAIAARFSHLRRRLFGTGARRVGNFLLQRGRL